MKKLISILLMLMVLIANVAMAEGVETDAGANAADVQAEATQQTADEGRATEEAASDPTEQSKIDWANQPLSVQGLIVTAGGLAGTFLVLILFFLTIKLMQKVLK